MIPPFGGAAGSSFVSKGEERLHSNPLVSPQIPLSRDVLAQRCARSGITSSSSALVVDHTGLIATERARAGRVQAQRNR